METLRGIRCLISVLKLKRNRYLSLGNAGNLEERKEIQSLRSLKKIPNISKFWEQYSSMKHEENVFKQNLLKELITECDICQSILNQPASKRKLFIKLSTESSSAGSIVDKLLTYLEPFPFDHKEILSIELKNQSGLSLGLIRNIIEQQYLAWKYQADGKEVKEILNRYKLCLYPFRSLSNLRNNISLLETVPGIQKRSVAEKIYLLNQIPFDLNMVITFQESVAGLVWHIFPQHCPKILRHSHQYILFLVSVLKDLKFSEIQVQEGLPFLYLNFLCLMKRLNILLEQSQIAKHRHENNFLRLLFFPSTALLNLIGLQKTSFTEMLEIIRISSRNITPSLRYVNLKSVLYHVSQFYSIGENHSSHITRHPKYKLVSERQIRDTLLFLKENGFTDEEVAESIMIIFYPRSVIASSLDKIKMEEERLKRMGFNGGCVSEKTNFLTTGTKEKRKTLQLCLYYIEKPLYFSGDGMWNYEAGNLPGYCKTPAA